MRILRDCFGLAGASPGSAAAIFSVMSFFCARTELPPRSNIATTSAARVLRACMCVPRGLNVRTWKPAYGSILPASQLVEQFLPRFRGGDAEPTRILLDGGVADAGQRTCGRLGRVLRA